MNDYLKNLSSQIGELWRDASATARVAIVVASALCILAVISVGYWSSRPQYVTLASDLPPAEVSKIIDRLAESDITAHESPTATAVLVPKSQLSKARLAIDNVLGPTGLPNIPEPSGYFLGDPELRRYQLKRHKEEVLAQSISQIDGIEYARVTISQPPAPVFIRDKQPVTASVMVELRNRIPLSQDQAEAIVTMTAHSVEGLSPEHVSIVDTQGHQLSPRASAGESLLSDQYQYVRQVEEDLTARAEGILSKYLGSGNAIVRVTADIDFRESTTRSLTYDPDSQIKKSERILSKSGTNLHSRERGVAGVNSNIATTSNSNSQPTVQDKEEMEETEYENAAIVEMVKETPVAIRRLTIAAVVDLPKTESAEPQPSTTGAAAAATAAASPGVTQEQIEEILKQAVGFDATRGDEIAVVIAEISHQEATPPADVAVPVWDQYRELLREASLAIGSIVALVLGLLLLGRMRPPSPSQTAPESETHERTRRIAALSAQALTNPEIVERVVRALLDEGVENRDMDGQFSSAEETNAAQGVGGRLGRMAA